MSQKLITVYVIIFKDGNKPTLEVMFGIILKLSHFFANKYKRTVITFQKCLQQCGCDLFQLKCDIKAKKVIW